jgi:hypothetical protein
MTILWAALLSVALVVLIIFTGMGAFMDNDDLYEAAVSAAKDLFADTSVDRIETKEKLRALKDEIDIMIDALN